MAGRAQKQIAIRKQDGGHQASPDKGEPELTSGEGKEHHSALEQWARQAFFLRSSLAAHRLICERAVVCRRHHCGWTPDERSTYGYSCNKRCEYSKCNSTTKLN